MAKNEDLSTKEFLNFLYKLHERLTVLLDSNLDNRLDPIEEDVQLLKELYPVYFNSVTPWANIDSKQSQSVSQKEMFSDSKS
jgi:hypothetical protein